MSGRPQTGDIERLEAQLLKQSANEMAKNHARLKALDDNPGDSDLSYSDEFQLLHVQSEKFLTARADFRMELIKDGNAASKFRLRPRFRYREEGDKVPALATLPPPHLSCFHRPVSSHATAGDVWRPCYAAVTW